ncbi:fimbrial biogenesis chaperone [Deinococcus maricopensis]|uniref:Chaperone protein PmfD, putative n=1 Tax=Deinococcus maricopensis (strain DSM 21211 / LMG 22137 / NRRL B-23946 / LB-34) TaxID=709986 RepID=E8U7U9_DEIML|nr:fimbria/pilus periplasmic chaperone [Deinococcus maricopensis]ADV67138.1 chaperone protein PmfD, putative [Deinococcus maricopensis DSM 21211]
MILTAQHRLCLAGLALLTAAQAGSFSASPAKVVLTPQAPIQTIDVQNYATQDVQIQVQVQAWTVVNGLNVYVPTSDVIVTPPVLKIDPRGSRTVRVGWTKPSTGPEMYYRVFLQEVPTSASLKQNTVQQLLRFSFPALTRRQKDPLAYKLNWTATAAPDGKWTLTVQNTGEGFVNLASVKLVRGPALTPLTVEIPYVFSKDSRSWPLPPDAAGSGDPLTVRVQVGDKTEDYVVQVR